jgi:hypothetical protein
MRLAAEYFCKRAKAAMPTAGEFSDPVQHLKTTFSHADMLSIGRLAAFSAGKQAFAAWNTAKSPRRDAS